MDEDVWGVHDDVIAGGIPTSMATFADVLPRRGSKLTYMFDFGDGGIALDDRLFIADAEEAIAVPTTLRVRPRRQDGGFPS